MYPPELNRELLVKVVDHALSASNWNQANWCARGSCGTTMCIAGFVAIDFLGAEPVFSVDVDVTGLVKYEGNVIDIKALATWELGLTEEEAFHLFQGSNDAEDIRRVSEQILNSR